VSIETAAIELVRPELISVVVLTAWWAVSPFSIDTRRSSSS
jgi:hypothetical protein